MELDAEIFATGKWNGMTITTDDLKQIAETFTALGDKMRLGLKLGRAGKQAMTDGHPALGWVDKLWATGEKLMAHFTDLPDVVYKAVQKKLYNNVSVEMDVDVKHMEKNYPYVLTGVALLGADIPAVNTLKDLTHYMSRGAEFSVGRHAVFSAIAGQSQGGNTMELEQATKKIAELTTTVATFTTDTARLTAENADLKAKVLKFEADALAKKAADEKARITTKRAEVTTIFEDGVKSGAITPAQRTQYTKLLRIEDDTALDALDIADIKALTAGGKQFSREQGREKQADDGSDLPVDVQVVNEINAILAKKEAANFVAAQALLFTRNPKLAREYADFNDAKGGA